MKCKDAFDSDVVGWLRVKINCINNLNNHPYFWEIFRGVDTKTQGTCRVSVLKIGLLNLNLKTKWKKIALDKYIRIWIKINSIRLWYRTSIHSSFQAYCTGWEWILNFKSLLTMRMNTEFFCGPLFIEVTFFGEIIFFCVYQFLLRAVWCILCTLQYVSIRSFCFSAAALEILL